MLTDEQRETQNIVLVLMYNEEIRERANVLLYFEALDDFEKCIKLRDEFTVLAYEWCTDMYDKDLIRLSDYTDILKRFEDSFDIELSEIRDKYFQ